MNRTLLLILALAFASIGFATETTAKITQPSLPGGYSRAVIGSEVGKVAGFAVKTQAEATGKHLQLVKIMKVERQVVTGLNFRLEIEVADGSKHFKARAVVWKKLDGSLALTSWAVITAAPCAAEQKNRRSFSIGGCPLRNQHLKFRSQPVQFCVGCGQAITGDVKFCPHCVVKRG